MEPWLASNPEAAYDRGMRDALNVAPRNPPRDWPELYERGYHAMEKNLYEERIRKNSGCAVAIFFAGSALLNAVKQTFTL